MHKIGAVIDQSVLMTHVRKVCICKARKTGMSLKVVKFFVDSDMCVRDDLRVGSSPRKLGAVYMDFGVRIDFLVKFDK